MFDKAFCLRVGKVLTRNQHMLIKRHVSSSSVRAHFKEPGQNLPRPAHERLRCFRKFAEGCARYTYLGRRGKRIWERGVNWYEMLGVNWSDEGGIGLEGHGELGKSCGAVGLGAVLVVVWDGMVWGEAAVVDFRC